MHSKGKAKNWIKKVAVSLLAVQLVLSTVVTVALSDKERQSSGLDFLVNGVSAASEIRIKLLTQALKLGI